ncbi:MAG: hypothetical protein ACJA1H_002650, partial [Glaciecola sp.]
MKSKKYFKTMLFTLLAVFFAFTSCEENDSNSSEDTGKLSVEFEKYELENG